MICLFKCFFYAILNLGEEMKAKLIYNQSLSSSANGVFDEVKKNIDRYEKHIIIVPERYSFVTEKELMNQMGVSCLIDCEVLSINRLCNRVFGIGEVLDKQGGIVLIQKILQDHKDEFIFFKNMYSKLGFAENLYQTIMQYKSSGVRPEDVYEKCGSQTLQNKLQDIMLVYSEYEKYISQGFTDGIYKLEQLISEVRTHRFFDGSAFYFAFFESFTFEELKFINVLIEHHNYCVVGCRASIGASNDHIFDNSIYNQMQALFFEKGIVDSEYEYKEVLPRSFDFVKQNLFAYSVQERTIKDRDVEIYSASSVSQEVVQVLKYVNFLVYHERYRFKDINIAVNDIEKYAPIFQKELSNFDLNVFFDRTVSLANTELGRFVSYALECCHYNFMANDIFKLINNAYFGFEQKQLQFLCAFLTKYNLQGVDFLKDERIEQDVFVSDLAQDLQVNALEVLDELYDKLCFIKNAFSSCEIAVHYVGAIQKIFEYFGVESKTSQIIEQSEDVFTKKMSEQIQNKFENLLGQILDLDAYTEYSALNFSRFLQTGLQACSISVLPLSVDSVYVGDAFESTFDKRKIMILVGTNYGLNPKVKSDVGLIQDKEIRALSHKYNLEPKIQDINIRSRLKTYELCISPLQKLIIYFPLSTDNGDSLKPSQVVNSLRSIFCYDGKNLPIENSSKGITEVVQSDKDLMLFFGNQNTAKEQILNNLERLEDVSITSAYCALKHNSNIDEYLSVSESAYEKPLIASLMDVSIKQKDDKKIISASQIKEYLDCPFKHFANRALKLKEIKSLALNPLDVGVILHRFAELFVKMCIENGANFKNNEIIKIKNQIKQKVQDEYDGVLNIQSNAFLAKYILREGGRLIEQINAIYGESNFKPIATEYRFDDFKISTTSNDYFFGGSIDRIDESGDRLFIIDYKTGDATLSPSDIYYGNKLQLLIYSSACKKIYPKRLVAGYGYFPIKDKYINPQSDYGKKISKVDGYFLNDEQNIYDLDTNLATNQSQKIESRFINIYRSQTKDGKLSFGSKVLDLEQMKKLELYANKVIQKVLEEIECGYIESKPKKENQSSSCDYCVYSGVCGKELCNKVREYKTKNLNDIKEALEDVSSD